MESSSENSWVSNHDPITAPLIILCAGKGARMGAPKGLLPFEGRTWLEAQIERFSTVGRIAMIVLGHSSAEYFRQIPSLSMGQVGNVQIHTVINPTPDRGQFSSLQCGISGLIRNGLCKDGVFVLPVDVQAAEPSTWAAIWEQSNHPEMPWAVLPKCATAGDPKTGHPVWLSHEFCKKLVRLPATARLDEEIHKLSPTQLNTLNVSDAAILSNFNTPEDFHAAKKED